MGEGRKHIVAILQSMFWPGKARMEVRSPGGSIYWKKNLSMIYDFILNQDEKTLEIAETGPTWNKDHFLRIKRDVEVLTVQLEQAEAVDEEKEEEEMNVPAVPILKSFPSRKRTINLDLKKRCRLVPRKAKENSHAQGR